MASFETKLHHPFALRMGYEDGRIAAGDAVPSYDEHYSRCFDEKAEEGHWFPFGKRKSNYDDRLIALATCDTHYATYYRICSKKYFCTGVDFPRNWEDSKRKLTDHQRYSPPGTVGHYLGCTYQAATDEMLYYGKGKIDKSKSMLLVMECYFQGLLYLHEYNVLAAVCDKIGYEYDDPLELMMQMLAPETDNALTDQIGQWARSQDIQGLVYPTARYAQKQRIEHARKAGQPMYPMVNYVPLSSRMDFGGISSGLMIYAAAWRKHGVDFDKWLPIYADLNVILFSGEQLTGADHAIFWQACELDDAHFLVELDQRPTSEHNILWAEAEDGRLRRKPRRPL